MKMDLNSQFEAALPYTDFLDKYATPEQRRRWDDFHGAVVITDEQAALLKSFSRRMKVLVMAGTWCGDCVNQCPIFDQFAAQNDNIEVRFADRDDNPELAKELTICGGARVPSIVFLSEDGHVCGRHGDRTLSKYRSVVSAMAGASCPTGLGIDTDLTAAVVQDWLNEFERLQWMLRTSGRLRQLHGD